VRMHDDQVDVHTNPVMAATTRHTLTALLD
jgi:hypothetical protein